MLILECPHCQSCYETADWNKAPGIRDEPIPDNIEDWDEYTRTHTGRIDCPDCGQVAIYEDMISV